MLGEPIEHPERCADRVGALIEGPTFVGALSARDNLRSLALLRGISDIRVNEVLEIVGLVGRENDKASTYSLGMKQRLGIAAALLPDPELLVLDEPTTVWTRPASSRSAASSSLLAAAVEQVVAAPEHSDDLTRLVDAVSAKGWTYTHQETR